MSTTNSRFTQDMAAALAVNAKFPDARLTADAIAGYSGRRTVTLNTIRALQRRQLITAHGADNDAWYAINAKGRKIAIRPEHFRPAEALIRGS